MEGGGVGPAKSSSSSSSGMGGSSLLSSLIRRQSESTQRQRQALRRASRISSAPPPPPTLPSSSSTTTTTEAGGGGGDGAGTSITAGGGAKVDRVDRANRTWAASHRKEGRGGSVGNAGGAALLAAAVAQAKQASSERRKPSSSGDDGSIGVGESGLKSDRGTTCGGSGAKGGGGVGTSNDKSSLRRRWTPPAPPSSSSSSSRNGNRGSCSSSASAAAEATAAVDAGARGSGSGSGTPGADVAKRRSLVPRRSADEAHRTTTSSAGKTFDAPQKKQQQRQQQQQQHRDTAEIRQKEKKERKRPRPLARDSPSITGASQFQSHSMAQAQSHAHSQADQAAGGPAPATTKTIGKKRPRPEENVPSTDSLSSSSPKKAARTASSNGAMMAAVPQRAIADEDSPAAHGLPMQQKEQPNVAVAAVTTKKKKKKKSATFSPFRVKMGCVVAVRQKGLFRGSGLGCIERVPTAREEEELAAARRKKQKEEEENEKRKEEEEKKNKKTPVNKEEEDAGEKKKSVSAATSENNAVGALNAATTLGDDKGKVVASGGGGGGGDGGSGSGGASSLAPKETGGGGAGNGSAAVATKGGPNTNGNVSSGAAAATAAASPETKGSAPTSSTVAATTTTTTAADATISERSTAAPTNNKSAKRAKKRPRPTTSKKSKLDHVEVWTDPIPGHDDGWALIGKKVRCCFPKWIVERYTSQQQQQEQQSAASLNGGKSNKPAAGTAPFGRILEGEVVSYRGRRCIPQGGNNGTSSSVIVTDVDLLVDRNAVKRLPYLTVPPLAVENGNEETKRRAKLEETIMGGKNLVVVPLTLADACGSGGSVASKNEEQDFVARWVVRKRVAVPSIKPQGGHKKKKKRHPSTEVTARYVGDGNDAPSQQEQNFRWWASGRHRRQQQKLIHRRDDDVDGNNDVFFGEVTNIAVTPNPPSSSSTPTAPSSNKTTLAMVAVRRLIPPESTLGGRQSHHGPTELFDVGRKVGGGGDEEEAMAKEEEERLYRIPVEDLVVISRRVERRRMQLKRRKFSRDDEGEDGERRPLADDAAGAPNNNFVATHAYSAVDGVYAPLTLVETSPSTVVDGPADQRASKEEEEAMVLCHRCQRLGDAATMSVCSSSSSGTRSCRSGGKDSFWCSNCCQDLRRAGLFSVPPPSRCDSWTGPCCVGSCDCRQCCMDQRAALALPFGDQSSGRLSTKRNAQRDDDAAALSTSTDCCSTCRRPCLSVLSRVSCRSCSNVFHKRCADWGRRLVQLETSLPVESTTDQSDYTCRACYQVQNQQRSLCSDTTSKLEDPGTKPINDPNQTAANRCDGGEGNGSFQNLFIFTKGACPVDFELPISMLEGDSPVPSASANTEVVCRSERREAKRLAELQRIGRVGQKGGEPLRKKHVSTRPPPESSTKRSTAAVQAQDEEPKVSPEDLVFKPTCCRTVPFDPNAKSCNYMSHGKTARTDFNAVRAGADASKKDRIQNSGRRNVRAQGRGSNADEKKISSRAARANQRRMLKDVAAFGGAASFGLDAIAGREQSLRFGKSRIHGWGVFADEAINTGDMVVEYRGQLIGNAVADRREKEYERAKIGSDYMFRIDDSIVCDATKQGNVARFINASCSPNCYTQIITINESKRIVIYAKRDILPGEELCYDYKFPIEYDKDKRIKCHCGSPDCRGYMNWDKKYVLSPP